MLDFVKCNNAASHKDIDMNYEGVIMNEFVREVFTVLESVTGIKECDQQKELD